MTASEKAARNQAYRRGLCVDCQQVAHSAGRPRCELCHWQHTGAPLTRKHRRAKLIREMAGPYPRLDILALAAIVADRLLRLQAAR